LIRKKSLIFEFSLLKKFDFCNFFDDVCKFYFTIYQICIKRFSNNFSLYHKLVYICIAVKADCAAALGRKNELNN